MDTYATCEIPDKEDTTIVTRVIMNAFAPEWEEEYMVRNWEKGDSLLLKVMDYEPAPNEDVMLGKVLLPATAFQEDGFEGDLMLEDSPLNLKAGAEEFRALIAVEISMIGADEEKQVKLAAMARETYK